MAASDRKSKGSKFSPVSEALLPFFVNNTATTEIYTLSLHDALPISVAEADVHPDEAGAFVRGTSLWRDAWRRLLKNKLAVFGLVVVIVVTVASIIGPTVIQHTFGFTPDYIPSNDQRLTKSMPPFRGPNNEFSWLHPMGTDNAGRDQLARVLQGGQISLF